MSNSGKQAHDFYADVISHNKVWTIKGKNGDIIFVSSIGTKIQPFWSKLTRVQKIIKSTPEYSNFEPVEVPWNEFEYELAPKLKEKNIYVGVNWSGKNLTGFDMPAFQLIEIVKSNKEAALTHHSSGTPNGAP
ncbi:MAG: DUF2750 domain-containing protein [Methylotenera sp.]|nr:DUF2750 domain-containing protein [Methylotenera sp.]